MLTGCRPEGRTSLWRPKAAGGIGGPEPNCWRHGGRALAGTQIRRQDPFQNAARLAREPLDVNAHQRALAYMDLQGRAIQEVSRQLAEKGLMSGEQNLRFIRPAADL